MVFNMKYDNDDYYYDDEYDSFGEESYVSSAGYDSYEYMDDEEQYIPLTEEKPTIQPKTIQTKIIPLTTTVSYSSIVSNLTKDREEEKKKHDEFMAKLPTMSRAARERLRKKEEEEQKQIQQAIQSTQEYLQKLHCSNKPARFHKKTKKEEVSADTTTIRRREHRRKVKEQKKEDEKKRAEMFSSSFVFKKENKVAEPEPLPLDLSGSEGSDNEIESICTYNQRIVQKLKEEESDLCNLFETASLEEEVIPQKVEEEGWITVGSLKSHPSSPSLKKKKKILIFSTSTRIDGFTEPKISPFQKEDKGQARLRTKMCLSVRKNIPCRHKEKCRFAHNIDELVVRDCFYGVNCHWIHTSSSGCISDKKNAKKKCDYKHPGETKESYLKRMNLIHEAPNQAPKQELKQEPKEAPKYEPVRVFNLVTRDLSPKVAPFSWVNVVKKHKTEEKSEPVEEPEIVHEQSTKEVIIPEVVQEVVQKIVQEASSPEKKSEQKRVNKRKFVAEEIYNPVQFKKYKFSEMNQTPSPSQNQSFEKYETVLKVPKEMAMDALRIALQAGKNKIRIQLV